MYQYPFQPYKSIANTVEQGLNEYSDAARLLRALAPYQDYEEVRREMGTHRETVKRLRLPRD